MRCKSTETLDAGFGNVLSGTCNGASYLQAEDKLGLFIYQPALTL